MSLMLLQGALHQGLSTGKLILMERYCLVLQLDFHSVLILVVASSAGITVIGFPV